MGSLLIQPKQRGAKEDRLTPNQRVFVHALLADRNFNPTNAARVAGYSGCSQAANKLLHHPTVCAIIGKALRERTEALDLKAERVLLELTRIGLFNPKRMLDEEGNVMQLQDLPDDVAACIQSMEVTYRDVIEDGGKKGPVKKSVPVVKIQFWNKLEALKLLGEHLGIFNAEKFGLEQKINWEDLVVPKDPSQMYPERDEIEQKLLEIEAIPIPN